ncbi:MAG: prepilin-type N-terminal cleavage/methylation domain-containing protein [Phycisphaerales bacterium]|nr:MAG: prepilin-type N-terminal cleavage/methylation domain-containing protein [Phycisphaerales bacterium]
MQARRSFTLVELLVVISIIALLIAIMMPALRKARWQAKATYCMNNLRGLGTAVNLYLNEEEERLPSSAAFAHYGGGAQGSWFRGLQEFYGNPLIARCPADRCKYWSVPVKDIISNAERALGIDGLRHVSYALNYYLVKATRDPMTGKSRGPYNRLGMVRWPHATVYFVELGDDPDFAAADHIHPEAWPNLGSNANVMQKVDREVAYRRHFDQANYGFVDGHVERLSFGDTFKVDWDATYTQMRFVWIHNMYDPLVAR